MASEKQDPIRKTSESAIIKGTDGIGKLGSNACLSTVEGDAKRSFFIIVHKTIVDFNQIGQLLVKFKRLKDAVAWIFIKLDSVLL